MSTSSTSLKTILSFILFSCLASSVSTSCHRHKNRNSNSRISAMPHIKLSTFSKLKMEYLKTRAPKLPSFVTPKTIGTKEYKRVVRLLTRFNEQTIESKFSMDSKRFKNMPSRDQLLQMSIQKASASNF